MGFQVDAVDLPGSGADQTPANEVTFDSYVERVVSMVMSKPTPTMLVGHSTGGVTTSAVAEAAPEHVGRLVYLAGLIPQSGQSFFSLMSEIAAFPGSSSAAIAVPAASGDSFTFQSERIADVFYNACSPDIIAEAAEALRPQPIAPLTTEITLTAARWGAVPKAYLVCKRDQAIPPAAQHWMAERAACETVIELDADHSAFFSTPDVLAETLRDLASLESPSTP